MWCGVVPEASQRTAPTVGGWLAFGGWLFMLDVNERLWWVGEAQQDGMGEAEYDWCLVRALHTPPRDTTAALLARNAAPASCSCRGHRCAQHALC